MIHNVGDCVSIYSQVHGKHFLGVITKIYKRRHRMKTFTEVVIDVRWLQDTPMYGRGIPLRSRNVVNMGAAA